MLLLTIITFSLWRVSLSDMGEDDVRRTVEVPAGQEAILLLGGIANTEVKGRTINTIPQAELIFAEGDHCYPEELVFPDGVGAGIALTNRKDMIASCFGYQGTQPAKDCLVWKKTKNGSWPIEATRTDVTGPGSQVLHQVYGKDHTSMLFPSWTHCHAHKGKKSSSFQADDCAYFFFNPIGDSKDVYLMKIWLEGDKVRVSQPLVQRDTLKRRGCLVVVGENLFHLGGVRELVDTLNMGEQEERIKLLESPNKKLSGGVYCGGHRAQSCAACPQGNGAGWCNGDCLWTNGKCESGVYCGGHSAKNCAACPQGNGAGWCNGDCLWKNGKCESGNAAGNDQKWEDPGCKLTYRGYNQACIAHPVENESSDWEFNILSIGGEMQANDSRHDVSDIRSVKVNGLKVSRSEVCGGTDGGLVPDGKTEGGLLGSGRKDFAYGYLSKNTKQLTHLALAIGGRRGFGRQSEAVAEITIVKLEDDMTSLTKKSLIKGNHTKLTLGRYGMNFVRVPTSMFLGSVCTVKRADKSSSTSTIHNFVWLHILSLLPLFALNSPLSW